MSEPRVSNYRRWPRRFTEWIVYGFLRWFESFGSVWQTTLVCIGGTVAEDAFPSLDPNHLLFLLVLSLYATFTQNGLGHGNKLTAAKVDKALAEISVNTAQTIATAQLILQLARNEMAIQDTLIAQDKAIAELVMQAAKDIATVRRLLAKYEPSGS